MFYGFKNQVFAFITCSPLSHIYISTGNSISAFSMGLLLLIWHSFSGWILQFYAKNSDRFLSSGTNLCFLLWKRNRTGSWNTGTIYHLDTSWLTEGFLSSSFNTLLASTLFFFLLLRARQEGREMDEGCVADWSARNVAKCRGCNTCGARLYYKMVIYENGNSGKKKHIKQCKSLF